MCKKIAVIGGGLGGLSAAIRLQAKGFQVDLYEKNSTLGGKLNFFQKDGYYFDTGPSILTMPFVVDELFESIGKKRNDYLEFISVDPIARNFFTKDQYIDTKSDIDYFKKEISKLSINDANNLEKYLSYCQNIYNHSKDIFLLEPLHEVLQLIREKKFPSLLDVRHIDPLNTMHKANSNFFKNEHIQKIFDRYATYTGSNPYQAPAALNIIAYVELILGGFYIKGGMYQLAKTLGNLASELGVNINLNSKVEKIVHKNRKVTGLFANSQITEYDAIVANSDVINTFEDLIDGFETQKDKYKKIEPSLSGFVMLFGINKSYTNLRHHNVFYSTNYQNEFKEIFDGKIPDDPTIYVAITSKTDDNHAPKGHENWFVLINAPYLNDKINWKDSSFYLKNKVIQKLYDFGFDIEKHIEMEEIFTPEDLFNQYRSNKGSIYGISSNGKLNAFKRPANRNRQIEGLYFASGSAHPGGGIPLVILSGKHCAELINRKYSH